MTVTSKNSRAGGAAEEVGGTIKKHIGRLIGDEKMEIDGAAKQLHGEARKEVAKANARVKGAAEERAGAAKGAVGEFIDNQQMQVEGRLTELKGKARQKINE